MICRSLTCRRVRRTRGGGGGAGGGDSAGRCPDGRRVWERPGVAASPTAAGGGGTAGRVPVSGAARALTHATAVGAGGRAGRGVAARVPTHRPTAR